QLLLGVVDVLQLLDEQRIQVVECHGTAPAWWENKEAPQTIVSAGAFHSGEPDSPSSRNCSRCTGTLYCMLAQLTRYRCVSVSAGPPRIASAPSAFPPTALLSVPGPRRSGCYPASG